MLARSGDVQCPAHAAIVATKDKKRTIVRVSPERTLCLKSDTKPSIPRMFPKASVKAKNVAAKTRLKRKSVFIEAYGNTIFSNLRHLLGQFPYYA